MPTLPQFISTSLTQLSDNELLNYATTLADKLPHLKQYASLSPAVADVQATIAAFGTAVANAPKGSQADRMERNRLRTQVEEIIDQWSDYATAETPDNPVLWAQAGFNLTKGETTPRAPLAVPTKFVLGDGPAKGSVLLTQNPQAGARAYVYEYALVPADGSAPQWHYCLGTKGTCTVSGLLSGRQYMFRVAAWNGMGSTAYSAVETRYVQ